LAELRIPKGSIRRCKPWRIGEIEKFAPYLKLHAFPYRELFAEGEVGIVDPVTA
jgi:hypothetical protein